VTEVAIFVSDRQPTSISVGSMTSECSVVEKWV
jgi:hypothetical protein